MNDERLLECRLAFLSNEIKRMCPNEDYRANSRPRLLLREVISHSRSFGTFRHIKTAGEMLLRLHWLAHHTAKVHIFNFNSRHTITAHLSITQQLLFFLQPVSVILCGIGCGTGSSTSVLPSPCLPHLPFTTSESHRSISAVFFTGQHRHMYIFFFLTLQKYTSIVKTKIGDFKPIITR